MLIHSLISDCCGGGRGSGMLVWPLWEGVFSTHHLSHLHPYTTASPSYQHTFILIEYKATDHTFDPNYLNKFFSAWSSLSFLIISA